MDSPEEKMNLSERYCEIIVLKSSLEMGTWKVTGTKETTEGIIKVSLTAKTAWYSSLTSGMNTIVSSLFSLCPLLSLQEESMQVT